MSSVSAVAWPLGAPVGRMFTSHRGSVDSGVWGCCLGPHSTIGGTQCSIGRKALCSRASRTQGSSDLGPQ